MAEPSSYMVDRAAQTLRILGGTSSRRPGLHWAGGIACTCCSPLRSASAARQASVTIAPLYFMAETDVDRMSLVSKNKRTSFLISIALACSFSILQRLSYIYYIHLYSLINTIILIKQICYRYCE